MAAGKDMHLLVCGRGVMYDVLLETVDPIYVCGRGVVIEKERIFSVGSRRSTG